MPLIVGIVLVLVLEATVLETSLIFRWILKRKNIGIIWNAVSAATSEFLLAWRHSVTVISSVRTRIVAWQPRNSQLIWWVCMRWTRGKIQSLYGYNGKLPRSLTMNDDVFAVVRGSGTRLMDDWPCTLSLCPTGAAGTGTLAVGGQRSVSDGVTSLPQPTRYLHVDCASQAT